MEFNISASSPKDVSVDVEAAGSQVPKNTNTQFTNVTEKNDFISAMDSNMTPPTPNDVSVDVEAGGPQVPKNTNTQFTNVTERNDFISAMDSNMPSSSPKYVSVDVKAAGSQVPKNTNTQFTNTTERNDFISAMDSNMPASSPKDVSVDLEAGGSQVPKNTKAKFTNMTERNVFIRKFYLLLIFHLSMSVVLTQLCYDVLNSSPPLQESIERSLYWWMSMIILVLVMMVLYCLGEQLRCRPVDILGLILLTAALAVFLSCTSGFAEIEGIMVSILLVIVVLAFLITTTFHPKVDFTASLVMYPLVICIVLTCGASLYVLLWMQYLCQSDLTLLFSIIATVVFCSYIVFRTQAMVLNDHENHIKPQEFVYATIILYTDVLNLLVFVVSMIE